MKLNWVERGIVNHPARAWVQRHYEARLLEQLGGKVVGGLVLEIGCGRGIGCEVLCERFGVRQNLALDLDPAMLRRAGRRLARYGPERVQFAVGVATAIEAPDRVFDAVFDFGAFHPIRHWQAAVTEVARVLKPGGRFFFEEMTGRALQRLPYRILLAHPKENRFSRREFVSELEQQGMVVGASLVDRLFGDLFVGVGLCMGGSDDALPVETAPRPNPGLL
jgi:ubiquinone/menaquinone biosynthesis C-methylase UbiE